MSERLAPTEGLGVLHLFCKLGGGTDAEAVAAVVKGWPDGEHQVVPISVLGHKADVGFLALGPDWVRLRGLQAGLQRAGLEVADSYVSLTEVSEYARASVDKQLLSPRLYPKLPPAGKRAFCFYPMSKRRGDSYNWYTLDFEARRELMADHGRSGRRFAGRILQLVTGSTGIDDWEWGVSLFGEHPDDLKECVYTMRYDEASARYAEFGPFYAGVVGDLEEVLEQVGLR